jgi:hypothetical protein
LPERRAHLRADEAHPHHDRLPTRGDLHADAVAVGHSTQAIAAIEVEARDGETPILATRCDEKPVVSHALPTVDLDHFLSCVHPRDPNLEPGFDAVLIIEAGRLDQHALERKLTAEILLGQRRLLVWRLRLRPDQNYPSAKALLAKGGHSISPARLAPTITNV